MAATNLADLPNDQPVSLVFRTVHVWAVAGEIKVPAVTTPPGAAGASGLGDQDFIPPFPVSKAANESLAVVKARAFINNGGGGSPTVSCKLQKASGNGAFSDLSGYGTTASPLVVTTTRQNFGSGTPSLADDDQLLLVVTAIASNPFNLTFAVVLEHTVTT